MALSVLSSFEVPIKSNCVRSRFCSRLEGYSYPVRPVCTINMYIYIEPSFDGLQGFGSTAVVVRNRLRPDIPLQQQ